MTSDEKTWLAVRMSETARAIAAENIQRRHPDYDAHQTKMALFRMLVGDDLFRRAWPAEPLLAP